MIKIILNRSIITFTFWGLICFTCSAQSNRDSLTKPISKIIDKLSKEETIHLGYAVGFAGIPETNNKFYKLYVELKKEATEKELLQLTQSEDKNLVAYSFMALKDRNYTKLKDILIAHLSDTSYLWIAGGCTGVFERVNTFMLYALQPGKDKENSYALTRKEFEDYLKVMLKSKFDQ